MGEIAEMMLDGTLCACCGEYLGRDDGYPIYCAACAPDFAKVSCPDCGKRVKTKGLADHRRDKHSDHADDQ